MKVRAFFWNKTLTVSLLRFLASDLVWQNTITGNRLVWYMNGTSPTATLDLGVISTGWQITRQGVATDTEPGLSGPLCAVCSCITARQSLWLAGHPPVDRCQEGSR